MPVLFYEAQYLDHLTRAALLSVAAYQFGQQAIVTLRPKPAPAPRKERLRSRLRSFQGVEVVLEIEHLPVAFIAALMPCD